MTRVDVVRPHRRDPLSLARQPVMGVLIMTTFRPGSWTGEEDRIRKGEEAGLVLEGTLELWVEGQHFVLSEGDSFTFRRSGPHRCHNPGKVDTRVLWIMTPPSY